MKTLRLFLMVVLTVALSRPMGATAAPLVSPPIEKQWTVEGTPRKALLYVPVTAARETAPVIFVFHGHGGTMTQAARSFDCQRYWPEAIVVYMQGLNTPGRLTDPNGEKPGWQSRIGEQKDRDLKFFDAVFTSLRAEYRVDESRVFATGHSNGGSFTYLLWASRGKLFRAVAPSSAIPVSVSGELKPKPVLHLAGERDPLVRFAWQQRTIETVKRLNGCSTEGLPWAKAGTLIGTQYASKTGTPLVTLIHPDGHRFPPEAPALIVRFFKESSPRK